MEEVHEITTDLKIDLKNGWKGTVTLVMPRNSQRMMAIQRTGAHKMLGSKDIDKKNPADREKLFDVNVPILSRVYEEEVRKLVRKVDLKGPDGEHVTSQDVMETHPDLDDIFLSLAGDFCAGFGPKKKKGQS